MRLPIKASVALLAVFCGSVAAEDTAVARARATAFLKLLEKDPFHTKNQAKSPYCDCKDCDCNPCLCGLGKKTVFIWVGGCKNDQIRRSHPTAIHIEVPTYRGATDKRLVIPKNGTDWYWPESGLSPVRVRELLYPPQTSVRVVPTVCTT